MIFQKDKSKFEDIKKETQERYKKLSLSAKRLQGTFEFQEYSSSYVKLKNALIKEMLECSESDPLKYAFQMNSYVERIKSLGVLVSEIEEDIKKGESNEGLEQKAS